MGKRGKEETRHCTLIDPSGNHNIRKKKNNVTFIICIKNMQIHRSKLIIPIFMGKYLKRHQNIN